MELNTTPIYTQSLEVKALVAAIAIESFNFRENVHVNVVTSATDPSISMFIYVHSRCEQVITVYLSDENAVEQLETAYSRIRDYKKKSKSLVSPVKLAS